MKNKVTTFVPTRLETGTFLLEFLRYSEWFEAEKDDPNGMWAWDFVDWLYKKAGWGEEEKYWGGEDR